ncbi:NADPH-dependent F420 reductase [Streptomyces sp. Ac-502]|uniref:NADPH-dependent F420 reductase n=1 Tax=Streptomyces sp. Ac-502 TaxID=3342801 RepID=UPI003862AA1C
MAAGAAAEWGDERSQLKGTDEEDTSAMQEESNLVTPTIAFIGSGEIGSVLARLSVAAGLNTVMSNSRGPETLSGLIAGLGDRARAATPADAARAGGLVVVAVPLHRHDRLPADALAGKTVIDTMNYYPHRDGRIVTLDQGRLTSSELLQSHLPDSTVVKALHNLDYVRLFTTARPAGSPERSALPVSGDDPAAKAEVIDYMDVIGYDAVDAGPLADSWRHEPGTPGYVKPYVADYPDGLRGEGVRRWFREAPSTPVPVSVLKKLLDSAVRGPAGGTPIPGYVKGLRPDRA